MLAIEPDRRTAVLWALAKSAKAPLSIREVQYALAVDAGGLSTQFWSIPNEEEILSSHGHFLSKHSSTTAYSYYDAEPQQVPQSENESILARICVTYLALDEFDSGPCGSVATFEKRLDDYPLYRYASTHLGTHVRLALLQDDPIVLELLQRDNKVLACSGIVDSLARSFGRLSANKTPPILQARTWQRSLVLKVPSINCQALVYR